MTHLREWFWSWEWGPEPNRFLASLWSELDADQKEELLSSILSGPADGELDEMAERRMYGMLHTIEEAAADPSELEPAKDRLDEFKQKYSELSGWQLDGFVSWHSSLRPDRGIEEELNEDELVGIIRDARPDDYPFDRRGDALRNYVAANPGSLRGIVERLRKEALLTDRVFATILYGVSELPVTQWLDSGLVREITESLPAMDREHVAYALADLLRKLAKDQDKDERTFWELFDLGCTTGAETTFEPGSEPFQAAINHPLGRVTEALFDHLSTLELKADSSLPTESKAAINKLLEEHPGQGAAISVIATRIAYLHAVEPSFARPLLWIFDWDRAIRAKIAWSSFLFHPRWHRSLFIQLRSDFERAVENSSSLDRHSQRTIGRLLAQVSALEGLLEPESTTKLLRDSDAFVLEGVADQLADRVKLTDKELRDGLWRKTLAPWFDSCWPGGVFNHEVSESLAKLCAYLHEEFSNAIEKLKSSIGPVKWPLLALQALAEEGHGSSPSEALAVLLELLSQDGIGYLDNHWEELIDPLAKHYPVLPETKKLLERQLRASSG